jgi:uncharacterized damage-inducible protein DinB
MLQSIESFIHYFESIRRRTVNYIQAIPEDKIDWSPQEGQFTCGEIIRHIAGAEQMYAGIFTQGRWNYPEELHHRKGSLADTIALLESIHAEAMNALRIMDDTELSHPRPLLGGSTIKAWRILMMMVEHEIHHRSQLSMYLMLLGVEPPQIYGMSMEEAIARMTG